MKRCTFGLVFFMVFAFGLLVVEPVFAISIEQQLAEQGIFVVEAGGVGCVVKLPVGRRIPQDFFTKMPSGTRVALGPDGARVHFTRPFADARLMLRDTFLPKVFTNVDRLL